MTPHGTRAIYESAELLKQAKTYLRKAAERGASNYARVCLRTIRQDIDGMLATLEEVTEEER